MNRSKIKNTDIIDANTSMKDISLRTRSIFLISIICSSLILFLILEPHTRTTLFPFIAKKSFTSFIENSLQNGAIDTRKFWETREFYAPGSFEIKKDGFKANDLPEFIGQIIPFSAHEYFTPFLIFSSSKWQSVEFLTTISPADLAMFKADISNSDIILDTASDFIYKKNGATYIIFLRPIVTMQETNGFLDYAEYDKKMVENKSWLVVSSVF